MGGNGLDRRGWGGGPCTVSAPEGPLSGPGTLGGLLSVCRCRGAWWSRGTAQPGPWPSTRAAGAPPGAHAAFSQEWAGPPIPLCRPPTCRPPRVLGWSGGPPSARWPTCPPTGALTELVSGGTLSQALGAAETPTLGPKREEPGGQAGFGPEGTGAGPLLEGRSGELALVSVLTHPFTPLCAGPAPPAGGRGGWRGGWAARPRPAAT